MRLQVSILQLKSGARIFASLLAIAFFLSFAGAARADNAAFDLIGPKIEVRVQRAGTTLPIAEVPNLQPGDRLWVHPDLPDSQSVRYLMVVVFLRGATNPPPDTWFTRVETWSKPVHEEGVFVIVPAEAEEALVFLAPETGGAFSTLRTAVRGKPGAFVRAAQDLQQASLDRQRLEKYLESVRETYTADPEQLKSHTTMLARSLNMKLDQQCFDKPSAQQVPCLTQNTDQLVLDDAHSQTMVATLTSGAVIRSARANQFYTHGARWVLQSLCWRRRRCRPYPEHRPHGAVSIHSRAGVAQGKRTQPASEQSSFVSQSQVGDRDWPAAGAAITTSASARGRPESNLLCR